MPASSPALSPNPLLKLTTLLVVVTLISACSSTGLAYRFADRGVVWWLDDYVTLTAEQKSDFREDIRNLRSWHCESELPRYGQWLNDLRSELAEGDLPPQRIATRQQELSVFIEPLSEQIIPIATRLLASLTDEQSRELADNLRRRQQELEQEYLTDDTPEQAAERIQKRAERWLGSLNGRQQQHIQRWVQDRKPQTRQWLEGRARWQEAFIKVLDQRQWPDFQERLADLIRNPGAYRGDGYDEQMARNTQQVSQLVHNLLRAAEDHHWQQLQRETGQLQQDVIRLSCA